MPFPYPAAGSELHRTMYLTTDGDSELDSELDGELDGDILHYIRH